MHQWQNLDIPMLFNNENTLDALVTGSSMWYIHAHSTAAKFNSGISCNNYKVLQSPQVTHRARLEGAPTTFRHVAINTKCNKRLAQNLQTEQCKNWVPFQILLASDSLLPAVDPKDEGVRYKAWLTFIGDDDVVLFTYLHEVVEMVQIVCWNYSTYVSCILMPWVSIPGWCWKIFFKCYIRVTMFFICGIMLCL